MPSAPTAKRLGQLALDRAPRSQRPPGQQALRRPGRVPSGLAIDSRHGPVHGLELNLLLESVWSCKLPPGQAHGLNSARRLRSTRGWRRSRSSGIGRMCWRMRRQCKRSRRWRRQRCRDTTILYPMIVQGCLNRDLFRLILLSWKMSRVSNGDRPRYMNRHAPYFVDVTHDHPGMAIQLCHTCPADPTVMFIFSTSPQKIHCRTHNPCTRQTLVVPR